MSKKKATAICLPMSRTARIMNSAIGVDCVNQDMVALATKATEIFIQDLTRKAYELSDDASNAITYDDVQRLVHGEPQYDFLVDWIPKRIRFSEALRMHETTREINEARSRQIEEQNQSDQNAKMQNKHTSDIMNDAGDEYHEDEKEDMAIDADSAPISDINNDAD